MNNIHAADKFQQILHIFEARISGHVYIASVKKLLSNYRRSENTAAPSNLVSIEKTNKRPKRTYMRGNHIRSGAACRYQL